MGAPSGNSLPIAGAWTVRVRGTVQGVGFRPFVLRTARAHTLAGWVQNSTKGVEIHLEGDAARLNAFLRDLADRAPAAAAITGIDVESQVPTGAREFAIHRSRPDGRPTTQISPDLGTCHRCVEELFTPDDPRHGYAYINCTECGPRYSIILGLPYDRPRTTMHAWPMDAACAAEYHEPDSRRFHAQPVACPRCGPGYRLECEGDTVRGEEVIPHAAGLLSRGRILAIKGIGGYHLACDAENGQAVRALRERKFRKEKPFALMVCDLLVARRLCQLTAEAETLLQSPARPIVLAPARVSLAHVAPDTHDLGMMLPYTPLHHLLFAAGAPPALVMTSANRSSEPIAYQDEDALRRLTGIADGFLIGDRPVARRVEDSVTRCEAGGPVVLRRGRGYAPGAVTTLPTRRPILALGADLKSTITLVVDGQAFVSQHLGDLDDYAAFMAFRETIDDLLAMYGVRHQDLLVVRDAHPQYRSSLHALDLDAHDVRSVQHHRAHAASVLAECRAWSTRVVALCLDGTGYGDDGTIWGGEIFVGSIIAGLARAAHLRQADLVGGDAAARHPVQAAAGFLSEVEGLPDLCAPPFLFPERYRRAMRALDHRTRVFRTTSVGRLFDTAAALTGFTRPVTFEGQAAIWLEQLARTVPDAGVYPFPFDGQELDFRPLLRAVARDRLLGRSPAEVARAFHAGVARGLSDAAASVCRIRGADAVVASGGVFQNQLLLHEVRDQLTSKGYPFWINHAVPPNDGGVSLGQAALAGLGPEDSA